MSTVVTDTSIDYPTSDGKPMAETQVHRQNMMLLIEALEDHYAGRTDVYVGGNMLMFYERGNKHRHIAPDVFVVLGVSSRVRENYLVWEEAKPTLDLVIEVTSKTTRRDDIVKKKEIYQNRLGVREYMLFDPFKDYLRPAEQMFRLQNGEYVDVPPQAGRLPSEVLGLEFERVGEFLRLYDPVKGERIPTRLERSQRAESELAAERQNRLEAERRETDAGQKLANAQAEIARLRSELEAKKS